MNEKPVTQKTSKLVKYFGWVLGATGLINLAQDVGHLALVGKLKTWIESYRTVLDVVRRLLDRFLGNSGFEVTQSELNGVVLMGILSSAYVRATARQHVKPRDANYWGAQITGSIVLPIGGLTVAIGAPTPYSLYMMSAFVLPFIGSFTVAKAQYPTVENWEAKVMRQELLGVICIAVLVVALSNLFKV